MAAVGFEPTTPERLVPKTSALDHSAMLPCTLNIYITQSNRNSFDPYFKAYAVMQKIMYMRC